MRSWLLSHEMSVCCVGFDVELLLGMCGCPSSDPNTPHLYNDRIFCELLYMWVTQPEVTETTKFKLCKMFTYTGIFLSLYPADQTAILILPKGDGPEKHDLQIYMIADTAPPEVHPKH